MFRLFACSDRFGVRRLVAAFNKNAATSRRSKNGFSTRSFHSNWTICHWFTCPDQSFGYCLEDPLDRNIETDPVRASTAVAIDAAIDIRSLNANILEIRTTIAPPLSWSEESHDGATSRYGNVSRSGVTTYVQVSKLSQSDKTF